VTIAAYEVISRSILLAGKKFIVGEICCDQING
jgi:hypothetical protein